MENKSFWRENAVKTMKMFYQSFNGSQYDEYKIGTEDEKLLLAKICFAIYGCPTISKAKELWEGYTDEQRTEGEKQGFSSLLVGIIFIYCKTEKNEFPLPIFRMYTGSYSQPKAANEDSNVFIDMQRRTYSDWNDWKCNNVLPKLEYCYPKLGFFTAFGAGNNFVFDPDKDPDIEFGKSPACNASSSFLNFADSITTATTFTCGAIGIASMFTPLAPFVLLGSAYAGGSSAIYGTCRAIHRLVDKGSHGESLTDKESFFLWFSIAATPLNFTSSMVNAALVRGATEEGRIFSSSMRMFATILNFSTLGVDSIMIGFGIANLIEKSKNNQLTPLDVLQFSMSLFFFTNNLIQPKMAATIIQKAQEKHIQAYSKSLTDADAQKTFDKFLADNKGSGSIKDRSKIVRTINKINDPNKLFANLKDSTKIEIGGRKGRTLLISDGNNLKHRIRPNNNVKFTSKVRNSGTVNLQRQTRKCLEKINADKIEIDGKKIFDNLNDRQKSRLNNVIGDTAGKNENILNEAISIVIGMGMNNIDDVLSIVEILTAELKKLFPNHHFQFIDKESFIWNILSDSKIAMDIASKNDVHFEDPLKAVYHYRKHGHEFPNVLKQNRIDVYLDKLPKHLIDITNLAQMETVTNDVDKTSFVRKYYMTPDDKFAVVIENLDGKTISSMYRKLGCYNEHHSQFPATNDQQQWSIDPFDGIHEQLAKSMGFRAHIPIYLNFEEPNDDSSSHKLTNKFKGKIESE
ncbi:hypothetical protein DERF_012735, partial [Dermatophagoides farinae]